MKKAAFSVILFFLYFVPGYGVNSTGDSFNELTLKYKLEFKATIDGNFFPGNWYMSPINVTATPMGKDELRRFPPLLEKALSRYPQDLIVNNLKGIYIVKDLYCYGVRYGATYANGVIYLTSAGADQGYSDLYLIATFHHEFASILMHNYFFPSAQWLASNPGGVSYRYASEGDYKALMDGTGSLEGNDELYAKGFVNQYASTHMEEDFSEFSAYVFTYPILMNELIKKFPVIKGKYEVWADFYEKLDKDKFSKDKLIPQR